MTLLAWANLKASLVCRIPRTLQLTRMTLASTNSPVWPQDPSPARTTAPTARSGLIQKFEIAKGKPFEKAMTIPLRRDRRMACRWVAAQSTKRLTVRTATRVAVPGSPRRSRTTSTLISSSLRPSRTIPAISRTIPTTSEKSSDSPMRRTEPTASTTRPAAISPGTSAGPINACATMKAQVPIPYSSPSPASQRRSRSSVFRNRCTLSSGAMSLTAFFCSRMPDCMQTPQKTAVATPRA